MIVMFIRGREIGRDGSIAKMMGTRRRWLGGQLRYDMWHLISRLTDDGSMGHMLLCLDDMSFVTMAWVCVELWWMNFQLCGLTVRQSQIQSLCNETLYIDDSGNE